MNLEICILLIPAQPVAIHLLASLRGGTKCKEIAQKEKNDIREGQGVRSSNILSFCVKKKHISALVSSKTFFFHPDIVQPKY